MALGLIRQQVDWCEAHEVSMLCCPEAIVGGLADHTPQPDEIAIERGELSALFAPLASNTVTTIVGFTERADGRYYNCAAVFCRGEVTGFYRKRHPAIRRSIYAAGQESPVFCVGDLVFGILICNDSNYPHLARDLAARGAKVLFVPTNNALPPDRANVLDDARRVDAALAADNRVAVVRADVAGHADGLVSYGTTGIVARDGALLQSARVLTSEVIVADVPLTVPAHI